MKNMDIEKEIAQFYLSQVMSQRHHNQKQMVEPFLKRLLKSREYSSEPEQKLYEFILQNWLWCVPIWANLDKIGNPTKLKGYRMLNKEEVMKRAFDFG
jgi:hypothetical protein